MVAHSCRSMNEAIVSRRCAGAGDVHAEPGLTSWIIQASAHVMPGGSSQVLVEEADRDATLPDSADRWRLSPVRTGGVLFSRRLEKAAELPQRVPFEQEGYPGADDQCPEERSQVEQR